MNYARGAMLLYLLVNTGILFGITSLWGSPLQAATYWYVQQPDSVRAASNLADRQLKEMGPAVAIVTLQEFASRYPEHAYVRIPELRLICINWPDRKSAAAVDHLEALLPSAAFSYTSLNMLDRLFVAITQENCTNVRADDAVILANALLSNPRYGRNARYSQMHHMLMARMADMAGETKVALEHLTQAADYGPNDDVYMMLATTLIAAQRFDEAREYIRSALADLPLQPLRRYNSRKLLEQLNDYANELERLAQSGGTPRTDDTTENDEHDSSR
jgi:tetratricopeptide (TPR) repeat protein